ALNASVRAEMHCGCVKLNVRLFKSLCSSLGVSPTFVLGPQVGLLHLPKPNRKILQGDHSVCTMNTSSMSTVYQMKPEEKMTASLDVMLWQEVCIIIDYCLHLYKGERGPPITPVGSFLMLLHQYNSGPRTGKRDDEALNLCLPKKCYEYLYLAIGLFRCHAQQLNWYHLASHLFPQWSRSMYMDSVQYSSYTN
ncbi:hypothetical protein XENOCAPTIV_026510, partial [Xenoophorus captivus]